MQAEVKELVAIREAIARMEERHARELTPLKADREFLQTQITEELKKMGVLSQRFQEATVSRSVRKTVHVFDEPAAVVALKAKGLTDYVSESLTTLFWDSAAKEIAKEGKTDIPGLVIQEKEFLSVRTSDKEERRKVTTD
jgi:hypothetical protein